MLHLHTYVMINVTKIVFNAKEFLKKLYAGLDYLRISISPSYDNHSTLRKFIGWLMVVDLIALICVFIVLLNYIWIANECMFQKYMGLRCFKILIVLITIYFVLTTVQNYLEEVLKNWSFIWSWPTSHKAILFSYSIFTLVFFSYIFNSPLLHDFVTIEEVFNPLEVVSGGCGEYCTVGLGCSECFYTPDLTYLWDFGFELQRDSSVVINPTININIRVDIFLGICIAFGPISSYWMGKKDK